MAQSYMALQKYLPQNSSFSHVDFQKTYQYVQENLQAWVQSGQRSIYMSSSKTGLSRSILFEKDRYTSKIHVYIVFNKKTDDKRKGAFKTCSKVFDIFDQNICARLTMKNTRANQQELTRIDQFLSSITHSITFNYTKKGNKICIMQDYFDNNLETALHENKFTTAEKCEIAQQLMWQIAQFHRDGKVIRDLKNENFLFRREQNGKITVILSDLGHLVEEKPESSQFPNGTLAFVPPEIAKAILEQNGSSIINATTKKYDMWSLSYCLTTLFEQELREKAPILMQKLTKTYQTLFASATNPTSFIANELLQQENLTVADANGCKLAELIIALRSSNPENRPSIEECQELLMQAVKDL
jgi:serine/threonine protein kinase